LPRGGSFNNGNYIYIIRRNTSEAQKQLESFILECDLLRFTPSSLSRKKAVELAKVAEQLIIAVEKIS
jgi:hypothetical protein